LGSDFGRRVFVIDKTPLDDDAVPPPLLAGRRAYRFWYRDRAEQPRTFAVPLPHPDEIEYFRQIEDLARDLRDQCRAMRGGPAQGQTASTPISVPPIMTSMAAAQATPQAPVAAAVAAIVPMSATVGPMAAATLVANAKVLLAEVTDDLEFKREEV